MIKGCLVLFVTFIHFSSLEREGQAGRQTHYMLVMLLNRAQGLPFFLPVISLQVVILISRQVLLCLFLSYFVFSVLASLLLLRQHFLNVNDKTLSGLNSVISYTALQAGRWH